MDLKGGRVSDAMALIRLPATILPAAGRRGLAEPSASLATRLRGL